MIKGKVVPVTELVIGKFYWWTAASAIISVHKAPSHRDIPSKCFICNKHLTCGHRIHVDYWHPLEDKESYQYMTQELVQAFFKGNESSLLFGGKCEYSQFAGGKFIEMSQEQVLVYLL